MKSEQVHVLRMVLRMTRPSKGPQQVEVCFRDGTRRQVVETTLVIVQLESLDAQLVQVQVPAKGRTD
jgi:hypothetical protein